MNKFCIHCGSQINETDAFCSNCGQKIEKAGETAQKSVQGNDRNSTAVSAKAEPPKKESKAWIGVLVGFLAIILALIIVLIMLISNVVKYIISNNTLIPDHQYGYSEVIQVDPFEDDEIYMGGGSSGWDEEYDEEYYDYLYDSETPYDGPIESLEGAWYFSVGYEDYWSNGESTVEYIGFDCFIGLYDDDEVSMELIPTYGYADSNDIPNSYREYSMEELSAFEQCVMAKYDNGILYFTIDMYEEIPVELEICSYADGSIDGWYYTPLFDIKNPEIQESYCSVYMFRD